MGVLGLVTTREEFRPYPAALSGEEGGQYANDLDCTEQNYHGNRDEGARYLI